MGLFEQVKAINSVVPGMEGEAGALVPQAITNVHVLNIYNCDNALLVQW